MPPSLASPRRDRPALLHGTRVPQVYRRALALDWSRALRTHKLASFILKHDGDSDSDSEGEAERPPAKTGASGTAGATTRAHSAPPARLSMGGAALALTFGRHVQRRAEMQREYRSRAYGPDGERATGGARLASFTGGGAAGADVPGGKRQENRSELIDVAEVLRRHAPLLYRTFDGYASMDSKGDVASMAYNSYKIFITDCEVRCLIAGPYALDSPQHLTGVPAFVAACAHGATRPHAPLRSACVRVGSLRVRYGPSDPRPHPLFPVATARHCRLVPVRLGAL